MSTLSAPLNSAEKAKYEALILADSGYFNEKKIGLLNESINIVYPFYEAKKCDYSEQSLMECVLEIANIALSEIGIGTSAVLAILRYQAIKSGYIKVGNAQHKLMKGVDLIIDALIQVEGLEPHAVFSKDFEKEIQILAEKSKRAKKYAISGREYYLNQSENFRKLFLSLADDMRVILILLARQLYITRNINNLEKVDQFAFARESYYMYAPMAHQLGLYMVKTELEELSMKILEADMYKFIAKKLSETKRSRDAYIERFISPIKQTLAKKNIKAEIKGRPKSIHSIWNKMKKQNVDFETIYDLFAIRIIIDNGFSDVKEEKSACWNIYSLITDVWTPSPKRLRDWISNPKASGYESLHTTVLGPENKWVEVQIRTRRMDDIAEKGQAAHWKYKEVKGDNGHSDWLNRIREILENPEKETPDLGEKNELYGDNIFVFTPKGEIKKLRKGATVLDFAYSIHTRIGEQCIGAKINSSMEGLKYLLKNGDKIEVLTSKTQKPKQEWINFVASPTTKSRIKRFLNNEINKKAEEGKLVLEEKLAVLRDKYSDVEVPSYDKVLGKLRHKFKIHSNLQILSKLQEGLISVDEKLLYELFIEPEKQNIDKALDKLKELAGKQEKEKESDFLYIDDKLSGIDFRLAKCCQPIPGDPIFGFVSVNNGTRIHKANCPNAREMLSRYPYRIVKAKWKKSGSRQFVARIKVVGENTIGVVSDITSLISHDKHLNMNAINISANQNNMFEGEIEVKVSDTEHLSLLIKALKKIKGVHNAYRNEN